MSNSILVGTCGYSYKDWKGPFYPEAIGPEEYLRYYSLFFPFVEIDFSWYAMPAPDSFARMSERTGSDFRFAVKLHRSLTHDRVENWKEQAAAFARSLRPLAVAGKLATLLVQLPYSFGYDTDTRRYLAALLGELRDYPLAVEFRNEAWYTERVFEALAARRVALVLVDRPDLKGLPPEATVVTAALSYVRFHGRNATDWWSGDATSRYDYLYSPEELAQALQRIRSLASQAQTVLVAFNNHARGQAVENAQMLKSLLETRILS